VLEVCEEDGTFNFKVDRAHLSKTNEEARWPMLFFRGADFKMQLSGE